MFKYIKVISVNVNQKTKFKAVSSNRTFLYYEKIQLYLVQSPQIDISGEQSFTFKVSCNWQKQSSSNTSHCQLFQFPTRFSVNVTKSLSQWHDQ